MRLLASMSTVSASVPRRAGSMAVGKRKRDEPAAVAAISPK